MGHFGHTFLPMPNVFYPMPITSVRFLLRYLPTPKLDALYESSLKEVLKHVAKNASRASAIFYSLVKKLVRKGILPLLIKKCANGSPWVCPCDK